VEVDSAATYAAGGGGDGDVDRAVDWAQELPEGRGGGVTQYCSFTACENRGHPAAVVSRSAVPHRVDPTVEAMQTPSPRPLVGSLTRYSRCFELRQRENSVLPPRNPRHPRIGRVAFVAHMATKSTGPRTRPPYVLPLLLVVLLFPRIAGVFEAGVEACAGE
jgi:hypothetical protein